MAELTATLCPASKAEERQRSGRSGGLSKIARAAAYKINVLNLKNKTEKVRAEEKEKGEEKEEGDEEKEKGEEKEEGDKVAEVREDGEVIEDGASAVDNSTVDHRNIASTGVCSGCNVWNRLGQPGPIPRGNLAPRRANRGRRGSGRGQRRSGRGFHRSGRDRRWSSSHDQQGQGYRYIRGRGNRRPSQSHGFQSRRGNIYYITFN